MNKLIGTLIAITATFLSSNAEASSQAGRALCAQERATGAEEQQSKDERANNKCFSAEIQETTLKQHKIQTAVYALVAGVCTVECFQTWGKKKPSKGSSNTTAQSRSIHRKMGGGAPGQTPPRSSGGGGASLAGGCEALSYVGAGAELIGTAIIMKKKSEVQSGEENADGVKNLGGSLTNLGGGAIGVLGARKSPCYGAVANGAVSLMRGMQAYYTGKGIDETYSQKFQETMQGQQQKLSLGEAGSPAAQGGLKRSPEAIAKAAAEIEAKKDDPVNLAKAAVEAGFGPALDTFTNGTGGDPGPVFDAAAGGGDALATALDQATSSLGSEGQQLGAQVAATAKEIQAQTQDEFLATEAQANPQNQFASTSSGSGGGEQEPDIMGGMQSMMANLLGQAGGKKEKQIAGAKGVRFTRKPAAVTKEGFHKPSQSIFQVVGTRYRIVSKQLLSGKSIVGEKPSAVPKNLYLEK